LAVSLTASEPSCRRLSSSPTRIFYRRSLQSRGHAQRACPGSAKASRRSASRRQFRGNGELAFLTLENPVVLCPVLLGLVGDDHFNVAVWHDSWSVLAGHEYPSVVCLKTAAVASIYPAPFSDNKTTKINTRKRCRCEKRGTITKLATC
ncbi:hypothetical protein BaRGS_00030043, partial [Batillaria attramentaria]